MPLATPTLERIADCIVDVAPPMDVGETPLGRRRLVPIVAGRVEGPQLKGKVLPHGADFQLVSAPTLTHIHARYIIETDAGEQVYIENTGIRVAAPEVIAQLNAGQPVDPSLVYFRSTPRFETAAPRLRWLMESIFIGTGARHPSHVELAFFRVL
jgi:hypothetical protein